MYSIAVYMCDKAYGGPEEGGWWYTYGVPILASDVPVPKFAETRNELNQKYWDEMQEKIDELNKGRKPLDSVLCTGVYMLRIVKGLPKPFPDEIPHYE